ncbi:Tim44/TimA family putative adaptor protein [Qipengyuania flava]|uniref:Tim44/TimA family putative adaptor protein n=1 Tax=Qipengyuania TaxID=1855416 RepID=UPI001C876B5C|nr:Tim44/TimA family putative adaptor protein [Qipengyuania aestuarii]MCA0979192.1 Tim44/TimA family putative adaptor protein [Qipengyuania flava]
MITEIVILAAIAAFLGLRLYSVLGQRSEHEEEPVHRRFDAPDAKGAPSALDRGAAPVREPVTLRGVDNASSENESAIRAIASADQRFDLLAFLEGAKAAYGMILEAFWKGDKETLRELTDDDVYAGFSGAIDARQAAGETLENRLIRIEDATIHSAELDRRTARISVLFVSDIASLTRDKDGNVVAGSLDDAVESRDIWTFSRNVDSRDPNWVLDETDQG